MIEKTESEWLEEARRQRNTARPYRSEPFALSTIIEPAPEDESRGRWLFPLIVVILLGWSAAFYFFGPEPLPQSYWDNLDKIRLECRKSGGSLEWFGSQGYHCIVEKRP